VIQDQEPINPPETGTLTFSYPATPATSFTVQKTGSPNTDIDYVFFFTPDATGAVEGEFRVLQDPENNEIDVQYRSMLADDMGLRPPVLTNVSAALAQIDAAEIEVNQNLGYYGAKLRAMRFALTHAERQSDANREGLGNIVDADLARDSAKLTAAQVREELSRDTCEPSVTRFRPLQRRTVVSLTPSWRASSATERGLDWINARVFGVVQALACSLMSMIATLL
jgi:hypothetical protein